MDGANLQLKFASLDMTGKVSQRELSLKPAWLHDPDKDKIYVYIHSKPHFFHWWNEYNTYFAELLLGLHELM